MNNILTNEQVRSLLLSLGFRAGPVVRNHHCVFRHPESGCEIVFPANRDDSLARSADIVSIRDHLSCSGHLNEDVFDQFAREGQLPTA